MLKKEEDEVNITELAKLGELIETLGTKRLHLKLTHYDKSEAEVDETMRDLPTAFKPVFGISSDKGNSWKEAQIDNIFGLARVEVVMFYPVGIHKEKKGGDKS